ncbi:MAG: SRPBCC family protein [Candidatus Dormiibacterota bacterium]
MAKIRFSIDSDLPAERVLAVAADFSDSRPRYWPTIDPAVYRVHSRTATAADVTEGSAIMGGIWAREAYDTSQPGVVRARVQESNVFQPGGLWELRVESRPDGGSHIEVVNHRQAHGFKGHVLGAMMTLMGGKHLPASLQETLDIVSREAGAGSIAARS